MAIQLRLTRHPIALPDNDETPFEFNTFEFDTRTLPISLYSKRTGASIARKDRFNRPPRLENVAPITPTLRISGVYDPTEELDPFAKLHRWSEEGITVRHSRSRDQSWLWRIESVEETGLFSVEWSITLISDYETDGGTDGGDEPGG